MIKMNRNGSSVVSDRVVRRLPAIDCRHAYICAEYVSNSLGCIPRLGVMIRQRVRHMFLVVPM